MAEIVPNMKAHDHAYKVLPLEQQKEPLQVSRSTCSNSPENELTQLTPISPHLELDVLTLEHDMQEKVDPSGCTKWDPKEKQEARKILREYDKPPGDIQLHVPIPSSTGPVTWRQTRAH